MDHPREPTEIEDLPDEHWCRDFASTNAPDGVVLADPSMRVVWANEAALEVFGFGLDSYRGRDVVDFVHTADLDHALGAVAEASRSDGRHVATRLRLHTADDGYVDCRVTANTVERDDGVWFVLGIRSVGDEDAIEQRRRELRALATTFYVGCASMEWVDEPDQARDLLGDLADVLDAAAIEVAECCEDGTGLQPLTLWGNPRPGPTDHLDAARVDAIRLAPCEFLRDDDGATVRVWLESPNECDGIVTIRFEGDPERWDDANADVVSLMCSSLMATVRRCRRERELAMAATHDPLTGLLNRAAMEDRLEELIASSRLGTGELAVFFADLNHFKRLNDTRGHAAGDEVLRNVADGLRASIRPGDVAARIGGDEFVVAMLTRHPVAQLTDRLRHSLQQATASFPEVGVAIGAIRVEPGEGSTDVLERADAAMYVDKRRQRIAWTDPSMGAATTR